MEIGFASVITTTIKKLGNLKIFTKVHKNILI